MFIRLFFLLPGRQPAGLILNCPLRGRFSNRPDRLPDRSRTRETKSLFESIFFGISGVIGLAFGPAGILGVPYNSFDLIRSVQLESPADQVIVMSFDDVSGLIPGSPVVVNGQIAGRVERIAPNGDISETETVCDKKGVCSQRTQPNFSVNISVAGNHTGVLKNGTVGVITSPSGRDELSAVELLIPEIDSPINLTSPITGFSSFEKFWTSGGLL